MLITRITRRVITGYITLDYIIIIRKLIFVNQWSERREHFTRHMRIVHFIMSLQLGGSETMLIDIVNEQVSYNEVSLIVFNNKINNDILGRLDARVKTYNIKRKEKSRNLIPVILLNLLILKLRPEVIHSHHASAARIILLRRNLVFTAHTTGIESKKLEIFQRVFAISEAVKMDLEDRYSIKSIVIYNGIDFNKVVTKEWYSFDLFKVVQVGRLDHIIKGQHILIEALNILITQMHFLKISVDFIGEGDSRPYLENLVIRYGLKQNINFLGSRSRDYIYSHLKDYDLLVQPSLTEGFGLTIVEAMAAKLPVLVSSLPGPAEVIGQGSYGQIFKVNNSTDCAVQIKTIIENYNLATFGKITEEAYNYAKKRYSIKTTANKYLSEYFVERKEKRVDC